MTEKEYDRYLKYLIVWVLNHKELGCVGMSPACFDEFCDNDDDDYYDNLDYDSISVDVENLLNEWKKNNSNKHKEESKRELGELIKNLHELGIFEMKSRDDAIWKLRHTTLLESYYASQIDKECLDVEYGHIETTLYFTENGVLVEDYVDYYDYDEQEHYVYNEHWYPEQWEN